jgi:ABC-type multidrug transport system fused ATPase/permease subunit
MIKSVMIKMGQNARLGAFTEEMLSSLKLIVSFGKEQLKLQQYRDLATEAYRSGKKSAITGGIMGGSFMIIMVGFSCFSWGIGFAMLKYDVWNPFHDREVNTPDIVGSYQAVMYGMFTVIQIQTHYPAVVRALTVGKQVLDVIDRTPLIAPPADPNQRVMKIEIQDGISFKDVHFRYPTAPEHVKDVMQGASFKVRAGTSTAIVGPSGSGKSTIV